MLLFIVLVRALLLIQQGRPHTCCLLAIAFLSAATSEARGRIIHPELGIKTRYRIVFIICISRTVGHYTQCFVCELFF